MSNPKPFTVLFTWLFTWWFTCLSTLALATAPAQAQTVWRCGPTGQTYTDAPCPAGKPIDVRDHRSQAERQQARDVAASQQRLADALSAQRRARDAESAALTAVAGNLGPQRSLLAQREADMHKSETRSHKPKPRRFKLHQQQAVPEQPGPGPGLRQPATPAPAAKPRTSAAVPVGSPQKPG